MYRIQVISGYFYDDIFGISGFFFLDIMRPEG